ncbi:DUF7561 family protein [Halobellus sp. EA9]|uniref:DUF7561 family protein n=1 Tax=Halobellus sp. EA9 TaxID=3421647 RepID=UPI003EBC7F66
MTSEPCEACGRSVRIAGGIGDFWSFEGQSSGGMTLEFDDGGEYFLCLDCIDRLPDDREVTSEDVESL